MLVLLFPIIFGILGIVIAGNKGQNQFVWFAWCFFLPLIGFIVLLCMSNLKELELKQSKTCPKCAERVKLGAAVCKHCSYDFSAHTPHLLDESST
jgi:hypothetical protein